MTAALAHEQGLVIDLYCRISRDYDGTLRSVEAQEEQGRAWLAANGHTLGEVHRDHALSGWNPNVVRPGFNKLVARLKSGAAQGVWVRDLDRYTRKMGEAVELVELVKLGRVVAAGHSSYDLSSSRGLRAFYDDAVDAEVEAKRIAERSSRGKAAKVARGKSNASHRGFARPGFLPNPEGWTPGDPRLEVPAEQLEREVAAVRDAAERLLSGGTMASIVDDWNEAGLMTTTGKRWDGTMVRQVLKAPSIAGLLCHKGEVIHDLGDGALDRETWERLQLHFTSRKRGRPAATYLLSGIIECSRCGSVMYGRPRITRSYPDGSVKREYWCPPRAKEQTGCGRLVIDQRQADTMVEVLVVERLGDSKNADRMSKVAAKLDAARGTLLSELAQLEKEADETTEKAKAGKWSPSRTAVLLDGYEERIEEVRGKLAALGQTDTTARVDTLADWKNGELAERREMIRRAFPEGLTLLPSASRGMGSRNERRFVAGHYRVTTE